jgi:hypothetical protein
MMSGAYLAVGCGCDDVGGCGGCLLLLFGWTGHTDGHTKEHCSLGGRSWWIEGREAGQAWPRSWVVGDSVGRWPTLQL